MVFSSVLADAFHDYQDGIPVRYRTNGGPLTSGVLRLLLINQSINQSIFIPPKIKRHILSYVSSWKSKNTQDILYTSNRKVKDYI